MDLSHSINPLLCICCERLLGALVLPAAAAASKRKERISEPAQAGRFPWVAENEENAYSCSASWSFSCNWRNAGSCPAVCLSLSLSLFLSPSHTHTCTVPYMHSLLLPASLLSLSFFLSPAPFPSDCQTRCQRSIAGCSRRSLRVFSFSLYPHTHTQKCTPPHVTWILNVYRSLLFF